MFHESQPQMPILDIFNEQEFMIDQEQEQEPVSEKQVSEKQISDKASLHGKFPSPAPS